jgi:GT2 family glycosyltransferase
VISVVIPAYNNGALTINCLNDVLKTYGVEHEVLLIDDGSTELMYKALPRLYPSVKVLRNDVNSGFIKSVNRGIQESKGDVVLLLNNDVRIADPKWLTKLVDGMNGRALDMASVAGARTTKDWHYIPGEVYKAKDDFTYLVGWCLAVKRKVFDKVGLLDEDFGFGFWDDVLLSYRAKQAGFKLGIVEGIGIKHLYHSTFKSSGINVQTQYTKNRDVFLRKLGK